MRRSGGAEEQKHRSPWDVPGSTGEMTDAALIAACSAGDVAALGQLFDRFSPVVYRFVAQAYGVSRADLDDLVSTTFLEACRSSRQFRGESSAITWLLGIAVNVVRHYVRSDVRRRAFLNQYELLPSDSSAERPDDMAERRQLILRLAGVLRGLPRNLRLAFVMCEVEQVANREVARTLGVPRGTLRRHLHEARKALEKALS